MEDSAMLDQFRAWGYVGHGAIVRDGNGEDYQVVHLPGAQFVILQSLQNEQERINFDPVDPIDEGYTMVKPAPPKKRTRRAAPR